MGVAFGGRQAGRSADRPGGWLRLPAVRVRRGACGPARSDHARLIGPRTRPFLIDERPRLCVGVRFVPGFAQAAFGLPASELLDQRVEYDLVYPNADADLESISAARTDAERVAGILALALRRFRSATRVPSSLRLAIAAHRGSRGRRSRRRAGRPHRRLAPAPRAAVRHARGHDDEAVCPDQACRGGACAGCRRAGGPPGRRELVGNRPPGGLLQPAAFIRDFKALTGVTPGRWIRSGPAPPAKRALSSRGITFPFQFHFSKPTDAVGGTMTDMGSLTRRAFAKLSAAAAATAPRGAAAHGNRLAASAQDDSVRSEPLIDLTLATQAPHDRRAADGRLAVPVSGGRRRRPGA